MFLSTSASTLTPRSRRAFSSLMAFIGYGGWSYFVNADVGRDIALRTLLIYGSYAACSTYIFSHYMETVFAMATQRFSGTGYSTALTFLSACLLMYFASWLVNMLAGTPRIFLTILPGLIFSTVFAAGYVSVLRSSRANQHV